MDTSRARAVLARTPALEAGHLRELLDAAGGEPERAVGARVTQRLPLPGAAQRRWQMARKRTADGGRAGRVRGYGLWTGAPLRMMLDAPTISP